MKPLILLFLISMAIVMSRQDSVVRNINNFKVKFPLIILQQDLDAIAAYYKVKKNYLDAAIYWPKNVVFKVNRKTVNNEDYLIIPGKFQKTVFYFMTYDYRDLYYKNGEFYYFSRNDAMTPKPIPPTTVVYYDQLSQFSLEESYLLILYRNFQLVKETIESFYSNNRFYVDSYSEDSPSTYLATRLGYSKQFLEFTTWSEKKPMGQAKGGLLTLIGKLENGILSVEKINQCSHLVLNQKKRTVEFIPDQVDVLGVRMGSIGFLEEILKDKRKMLSADDIALGAGESHSEHIIFVEDFLEKLNFVEPKTCVNNDGACLRSRPKKAKFQVQGHLLLKRVNYVKGSYMIDDECPFVVEYELKGPIFKIGTSAMDEICTDNKNIWDGSEDAVYTKQATPNPREVVILSHP